MTLKQASPLVEIKVLSALKHGPNTAVVLAERAGVNERTAKRALKQLKDADVVTWCRECGWDLAEVVA